MQSAVKKKKLRLKIFMSGLAMCGCLEWWMFESCTEGSSCHELSSSLDNKSCCQERAL